MNTGSLETVDQENVDGLAVVKLTKDLLKAAETIQDDEARYLIRCYYIMQQQRMRAASQIRSMSKDNKPNSVIGWYFDNSKTLEGVVASALAIHAKQQPLGRWAMSVCGIAHIFASGLAAHVDVTVPTPSNIWRFAGLDPTITWGKKEKCPWNADLKTICWNMGESFVKQQNRKHDFYGKFYRDRKGVEREKNESGEYAGQAKKALETKRYGQQTVAYAYYKKGKLPPAQIHSRAKRYAVKIFLSHYHAVGQFIKLGRLPAKPYAFVFMGHAHLIAPPNMDLVPGLADAWSRIG